MDYINKNNIPQLASKKDCTACLACVSSCPQKAIAPYLDSDGHVYVKIDKEKCIGCKRCEVVCKNSRNCYGNNNLFEWEDNCEPQIAQNKANQANDYAHLCHIPCLDHSGRAGNGIRRG